jgi:hypothetical protein
LIRGERRTGEVGEQERSENRVEQTMGQGRSKNKGEQENENRGGLQTGWNRVQMMTKNRGG